MKYFSKILELSWTLPSLRSLLGCSNKSETTETELDICINKFEDDGSFYLMALDRDAEEVSKLLYKSNMIEEWERKMDSGLMIMAGDMEEEVQVVKTTLNDMLSEEYTEDRDGKR